MTSILSDLKSILKESNRVSGTVVGTLSSGAIQVRTAKGVVNALPPGGVSVVNGTKVIVDNGNVYLGLNGGKKEPTVYRV